METKFPARSSSTPRVRGADSVAAACGVDPLGITPLRRTVVQLRCDGMPSDFPLVIDLNGDFYFKPESEGRLWLTPHDETPDIAPRCRTRGNRRRHCDRAFRGGRRLARRGGRTKMGGPEEFRAGSPAGLWLRSRARALLLVCGPRRVRHPDGARCGSPGGVACCWTRRNRRRWQPSTKRSTRPTDCRADGTRSVTAIQKTVLAG